MTDWTTIGTAVGTTSPLVPDAITIAERKPYTWLSLNRYAKVMGIPGMPFNTGTATNTDGEYVTIGGGNCEDFWWEHDWQDRDKVSRESLLSNILDAEHDIMRVVGYPLAPTWIAEEVQPYPGDHRPDMFGGVLTAKGKHKALHTKWGKIISPGRRAVSLIEADATYTLEDHDADGFYETVKITTATTLTDPREIKIYHAGFSGDPGWEIRPCRTKTISSGTFTAYFWTWQFIDPDLLEAFPTHDAGATNQPNPIDLSGAPPTTIVDTIDIYREYNDATQSSAQLIWESSPSQTGEFWCTICNNTGCEVCTNTTQDGCFDIRDGSTGLVAPWPASYDSTDLQWERANFSVCREPDRVKLWYYAGEADPDYIASRSFDPLSNFWAKNIAYLATARLEKPPCSCGNVASLYTKLMQDMAIVAGDISTNVNFEALDNPFGTRWGEMWVYGRIRKLADKKIGGFAL